MDKILVTQKDLDFLMKWRDAHKDLVRTIPDSTLTKTKRKRTGNAVTYIFTKGNNIIGNGRIITGRQKPQVAFTVRGHFRQYKSGKRVWIHQFTKGAGKTKNKNYKLGGLHNE